MLQWLNLAGFSHAPGHFSGLSAELVRRTGVAAGRNP